jgi:thiamine-phosphate pyrophosphorylase
VSRDLARPTVYLITTGECRVENYSHTSGRILDIVRSAVDAGVDLIQLREKQLSAKLLFELTQNIVEITSGSRTKLLVNDRLDIALAAGADGVHLTSTAMPAEAVRAYVSDNFLIGVSCHSSDDIGDAAAGGADFALYGAVFASPGKGEGLGLEALSEVCRSRQFPVVAVGGIDETNFRHVVDAGAIGFAAIRALNDVDSMRRIINDWSHHLPGGATH